MVSECNSQYRATRSTILHMRALHRRPNLTRWHRRTILRTSRYRFDSFRKAQRNCESWQMSIRTSRSRVRRPRHQQGRTDFFTRKNRQSARHRTMPNRKGLEIFPGGCSVFYWPHSTLREYCSTFTQDVNGLQAWTEISLDWSSETSVRRYKDSN